MNRNEKAAAGMLAGLQAGHAQARQDKRLAADAAHAGDVAMMPLAAVLGRVGGVDTREPAPDALDAMTASLDALGLVEPLAVDSRGRLLAGKTRLIALRRLAAKDPERWRLVPVRRFDFDAEADTARALAVEVAENEQRRDYTAAEVKALAERLQAAGFRATPGRPRKGERAMLPALGALVGLHKRQLLNILAPDAEGKKVQNCTFSETAARLRRALGAFALAAEACRVPEAGRRIVRDAAALADLLDTFTKGD